LQVVAGGGQDAGRASDCATREGDRADGLGKGAERERAAAERERTRTQTTTTTSTEADEKAELQRALAALLGG
jgi:hypothetical protein